MKYTYCKMSAFKYVFVFNLSLQLIFLFFTTEFSYIDTTFKSINMTMKQFINK